MAAEVKQDNFAQDAEPIPGSPSLAEHTDEPISMSDDVTGHSATPPTEHPRSCKVSQAQGTSFLLSICTQLLATDQQLQVLPPLARIPNTLPLSGDFEES